jgi:hypothetical protein
VFVNHWREISQWDRAATLARRYVTDNPTDNGLEARLQKAKQPQPSARTRMEAFQRDLVGHWTRDDHAQAD